MKKLSKQLGEYMQGEECPAGLPCVAMNYKGQKNSVSNKVKDEN